MEIVGKAFPKIGQFLEYLEGLRFSAWRPRYIVLHHTGIPNLAAWEGWQARGKPTDAEWLQNLGAYYRSLGWSSGPHFFITPKNFCVLSSPTKRGTHAASFNAASWGVEVVGNFDVESFDGEIRDRVVDGLAALYIAAGLEPAPFIPGDAGLHFHRDDPRTRKTCPGTRVDRAALSGLVVQRIAELTSGDHPEETLQKEVAPRVPEGFVRIPDLNLRGDASAKAPILAQLGQGQSLAIYAETWNGPTRWYRVWLRLPSGEALTGWVAATYVQLKGE